VDFPHQIWIAEVQLIVAAIYIHALGIEHGTHRTIDYMDGVGIK
jgi:hypothetical protein